MATFIDLTNRLLRSLNEVELNPSNFASTRGVHSTCKDAICDAVSMINSYCYEWPFNAFEHSQNLIPGTNEYGWPVDFKSADWNSFQIKLNNNSYRTLKKIKRDEWYSKYRDRDYNAGADGLEAPYYVFESHGRGFGVTPVPDQNYDLKFRYYVHPQRLELATDETTIYPEWEWVIILGAKWAGNLFKEDEGTADRKKAEFDRALQSMRTLLVNKREDVTTTVLDRTNKFF